MWPLGRQQWRCIPNSAGHQIIEHSGRLTMLPVSHFRLVLSFDKERTRSRKRDRALNCIVFFYLRHSRNMCVNHELYHQHPPPRTRIYTRLRFRYITFGADTLCLLAPYNLPSAYACVPPLQSHTYILPSSTPSLHLHCACFLSISATISSIAAMRRRTSADTSALLPVPFDPSRSALSSAPSDAFTASLSYSSKFGLSRRRDRTPPAP